MRDLEQEVLLQTKELGLCGDVADGVERPSLAELRAHDLEDAHPILAREPGATDVVTVGVLHRRRAGDEEQLLERTSIECLFAEHAEGGRVRAHDEAIRAGEDDAVGERDERVLDRELFEGAVLVAPTERAASFGWTLFHCVGIRRRTRVP